MGGYWSFTGKPKPNTAKNFQVWPEDEPHSPGDALDDVEEERQRQDGDEEPGEDDAHHPQAEQHQGQVLEQHLRLHGETHINCSRRDKTTQVRQFKAFCRYRGKSHYKAHMSSASWQTNTWQEATPPGSPQCTSTDGEKVLRSRRIRTHPRPCPARSEWGFGPGESCRKSALDWVGGGGRACRGAQRQPWRCTVETERDVWVRHLARGKTTREREGWTLTCRPQSPTLRHHMLHMHPCSSERLPATVTWWRKKKKVSRRRAVKCSIIMSFCEADIKVRT